MANSNGSKVFNVKASHDLALAIAAAHGLPGAGMLRGLTLHFAHDEPLVITAQFYADPGGTAEALAAAAGKSEGPEAGHAA